MDSRAAARAFLVSRRARLTPEQAGLPAGSGRRVPGLRRAEVAILANVSVEYYTRLERGDLAGASEAVLNAVAGALQLDDAEHAHLFDLARAVGGGNRRGRSPERWTPRAGLQRALDAIAAPAFVGNGRADLLAANRLGYALYFDLLATAGDPPNFARFAFLDPDRSQRFHHDWDKAADISVELLRAAAAKNPHDRATRDLIGELSTRSEEFRARWAAGNVRLHASGVKRFHHPIVGELELAFENTHLATEPGLSLLIYTAEPASTSEEGLRLLASWATTIDLPGHPAMALPERTDGH